MRKNIIVSKSNFDNKAFIKTLFPPWYWNIIYRIKPKKEKVANYIYYNNYDDILLMDNFNAKVSENSFSSFCELYEVKSIINQSTCHKNSAIASFTDLFLTSSSDSFQKSTVVETGLSDFHKLIVSSHL